MRLLRCGNNAVLIEVDNLDAVDAVRVALAAAADRGQLPGLVELVPAARTVLAAGADVQRVRTVLASADLVHRPPRSAREVRIPVRYDGPDQELVAKTAGISVAELTELHSGARYSVAFTGFVPGFGYLVGLPEPLIQARLERPRTRVPAGSVGIAGEFTGIYPRSSPGGWRLIGHTETVLFDTQREPPALLVPGDLVGFEVIH